MPGPRIHPPTAGSANGPFCLRPSISPCYRTLRLVRCNIITGGTREIESIAHNNTETVIIILHDICTSPPPGKSYAHYIRTSPYTFPVRPVTLLSGRPSTSSTVITIIVAGPDVHRVVPSRANTPGHWLSSGMSDNGHGTPGKFAPGSPCTIP